MKRREFMKAVLGAAVAPLCLAKALSKEKAITPHVAWTRISHSWTFDELKEHIRATRKPRYCVICEYPGAEAGDFIIDSDYLPWSLKIVQYTGGQTLRRGDRIWYVDESLAGNPGAEVDHLPMGRHSTVAGFVRTTPEEYEKMNSHIPKQCLRCVEFLDCEHEPHRQCVKPRNEWNDSLLESEKHLAFGPAIPAYGSPGYARDCTFIKTDPKENHGQS